MLAPRQLVRALSAAKLVTAQGPWFRAVAYHDIVSPPRGLTGPPQPLWGGAAKLAGARFTPRGGFDSIYLAHDPITAFVEVNALVLLPGGPAPIRSAPWVIVSVEGRLNHLPDLSDPVIPAEPGTTEKEMTGPWVEVEHPPRQTLSQSAYDSGRITGIK